MCNLFSLSLLLALEDTWKQLYNKDSKENDVNSIGHLTKFTDRGRGLGIEAMSEFSRDRGSGIEAKSEF